MAYMNECIIKFDGDNVLYEFGFDDYYNGANYIVVDKQLIGEYIGKQILEENKDFNVDDDYIEIYEKIDDIIGNSLINEIYGSVEAYLGENLE